MSSVAFAKGETDSILSCGSYATYIIKDDASLWGCGWSYVGNGTVLRESQIEFVKILENVRSVSSYKFQSVAVKKDNTLWVCGSMYKGDGTTDWTDEPVGFEKVADNVIDMYAYHDTVFYITDDHKLWGYGDNGYAQLGNMEATVGDKLTPIMILDDVKKYVLPFHQLML